MPMTGAPPATGGFYNAYVCVRDKKAQNTMGGTFTLGAWRTRDVTEELADADGICSIASNQITLAAGTYRCLIVAASCYVGGNQLRLQNITDSTTELVGHTSYTHPTYLSFPHATLAGRFTLAAQKTLEVQHYCDTTKATNGFGYAMNFTDEIYLVAEFLREA